MTAVDAGSYKVAPTTDRKTKESHINQNIYNIIMGGCIMYGYE